MDRNKHKFEEEINRLSDSESHTKWFTMDRIDAYIEKVQTAKAKTSNKTPDDYKILKRYDCVKLGSMNKLILAGSQDPMKYFDLSAAFDTLDHEERLLAVSQKCTADLHPRAGSAESKKGCCTDARIHKEETEGGCCE